MRNIFNFTKKNSFLIWLIIFFALADCFIGKYFSQYFIFSGDVYKNDYEITKSAHPEEVWDKVFFGNSTVISGYREELSDSGFVNFGVDYGVLTDLRDMLKKDILKVGSELVVGLNWLALYDEFDTNPNYIWHKKMLEPYSYFYRDRLFNYLKRTGKELLLKEKDARGAYINQKKSYYYSCLPQNELESKAELYEELYWNVSPDKFKKNYQALKDIINICEKNNIRFRVLWMPWNPVIEQPELVKNVKNQVDKICAENEIEVFDMTGALDTECFHDLGHLNYEYGSRVFTEEVSKWLKK